MICNDDGDDIDDAPNKCLLHTHTDEHTHNGVEVNESSPRIDFNPEYTHIHAHSRGPSFTSFDIIFKAFYYAIKMI